MNPRTLTHPHAYSRFLTLPHASSRALRSLGLGCASYGETNFSMVGLLILIGASASGGLRWALIQRQVKARV